MLLMLPVFIATTSRGSFGTRAFPSLRSVYLFSPLPPPPQHFQHLVRPHWILLYQCLENKSHHQTVCDTACLYSYSPLYHTCTSKSSTSKHDMIRSHPAASAALSLLSSSLLSLFLSSPSSGPSKPSLNSWPRPHRPTRIKDKDAQITHWSYNIDTAATKLKTNTLRGNCELL